jgi:hypothetical protein
MAVEPADGAEVLTLTPVLAWNPAYQVYTCRIRTIAGPVFEFAMSPGICTIGQKCSCVVPAGKLSPDMGYKWRCVPPGGTYKTFWSSDGNHFTTAPSLTVEVGGQGQVKSTPSGMVCSAKCSSLFPKGKLVSLQFIPAAGWNLGSFSGDCKETAQEGAATAAKKGAVTAKEAAAAGALFDKSKPRTASVKMDGNRSCKVTFVRIGKSSGKP